MRFFFLQALLQTLCLASIAQNPFTIYGTIEGKGMPNGSDVLIRSFYVDELVTVATAKTNDNGFQANLSPNHRNGLYVVEVGGIGPFEFLVGPSDDGLKLALNTSYGSVRFIDDSFENRAYQALLKELALKEHLTDSVGRLRGNVSRVDKQYYTKKNEYRKEVALLLQQHHLRLDKLKDSYSNSYTANVLLPLLRGQTRFDSEALSKEFDNHHSFYHHTFFDGFDLNDDRLLNHPVFTQQVQVFLREFSGEFTEDHINSVDRIFGKCENEKVRSFLFDLMTRHYWMSGDRDVSKYIVSNYSDGCGDDLDELVTKDGVFYPPLKTGDAVPSFSWNENGQVVLGSDYFKKNRLTLLVFWRSDCDHCEKELPLISSSSKNYYDKGLGVTAISMDRDKSSWQNSEMDLPEDWQNLFQKDLISKDRLSNMLSVFSTPSIVLVDQNGRFLAANVYRERLDKFLAGYLR